MAAELILEAIQTAAVLFIAWGVFRRPEATQQPTAAQGQAPVVSPTAQEPARVTGVYEVLRHENGEWVLHGRVRAGSPAYERYYGAKGFALRAHRDAEIDYGVQG